MKADPRFVGKSISFWAYVRAISEALRYSQRGSGLIANHPIEAYFRALTALERPTDLLGSVTNPSDFARELHEYFSFRADCLNNIVSADLMNSEQASLVFEEVKTSTGALPTGVPILSKRTGNLSAVEYQLENSLVRIPLNKQKNEKKFEAYLTGIVNLIIADRLSGLACDYDPQRMPTIDDNGQLFQTFSRRLDGSFPSTRNPIAMWEIKEYYYTTTFGSKISDAVYITSLDGYERQELERVMGIRINHLVMVDAYDTWWTKGRSYLCRMVDILHMGHVDNILFGREVVRELPAIVDGWVEEYQKLSSL